MRTSQWTRGGLVLAALIFAGSALAQSEGIPRRIDPGETPPTLGGELPPGWSIIDVTGQTPRTTMGDLAVDAWGGVYVWAVRVLPIPMKAATPMGADNPTPRREVPGQDPIPIGSPGAGPRDLTSMRPMPRIVDPGEPQFPDEGIGGPLVPVRTMVMSTLYYVNAGTVTPVFEVPDESGATVFVSRWGDVYATTNLPDGSIRAYHSEGGIWMRDDLPECVTGPAGAIVGGNTLFMRSGDRVLRHTGEHWKEEMVCMDGQAADMGGLVDLGDGLLLFTCGCGYHFFDGAVWTEIELPEAPHIHAVWGRRDDAGELHLFAAGCNGTHTQLQIFQFMERTRCTLDGEFVLVEVDPWGGGGDPGSLAEAVWGGGVHDVYLSGIANQRGHLFRFDGARWLDTTPATNLPEMVDVEGSRWGDLWVSLVDGQLLHRQPEDVPVGTLAQPAPVAVERWRGDSDVEAALLVTRDAGGLATASVSLQEPAQVALEIFDLAGRHVTTLENGVLPAGIHRRSWNPAGVPSGIYFCRLKTGGILLARKVLVNR